MNASESEISYSPRALKAKAYFEQGYNCAQSVLLAFEGELGIAPETAAKLSSSFGGGMARLREVCGAVSGLFMTFAAMYGVSDPKDSEGKASQYKDLQELAATFREENGSIVCRELLGLTRNTSDPTPEKRTDDYYRKRPCGELVACATQIMEKYIQNKESNA